MFRLNRVRTGYQRRLARWFGRRRFVIPAGPAIVSFTFDDFPVSALHKAGAILEEHALAGTYYLSLGLASTTSDTGRAFDIADVATLLDRGHEIGCHTYDHCAAWETPTAAFAASVRRNAAALRDIAPRATFRSLSYPISYPRPQTKRAMARHFACCRGGGQTFNRGAADLNYLSAFFLEQSRDCPDAIRAALDGALAAGGWLIFATHDVAPRPTRFGITPELFADVVRWTVARGATVLPVSEALTRLKQRQSGVIASTTSDPMFAAAPAIPSHAELAPRSLRSTHPRHESTPQ